MGAAIAKLVKYKQLMGMAVAALILTVIFVPFQTAQAFTLDLDLPNVDDLDEVPTSAVGSTFEVTIDVEAGELISVESIELILDNGEDTVKRAVFEKAPGSSPVYQRTSGDSTLVRGNLDVDPLGDTDGYGYGFGLVSDGTTFTPLYSYSFTYSYAFISGNSVGYSNAVGAGVTGIVGPGTITITGKLNTALMEAGVPHTLDILINTGTGVNPDHLVAPQLTFTTTGNSAIKTKDVGTGDDVEADVDIPGFPPGKFKVKFSKVNGAGTLVVHPGKPADIEDAVGDIFTSIAGGKGVFSVGTSTGITIGDVFDVDASSITLEEGGTYTITVPYDEDKIPSGVDEEDLKIFHYDEDAGEWEDITTDVDTEENTVTGETDSLSPIAAGYTESTVGGGAGGGGGGGGGAGGVGGSTVYVGILPESFLADHPLLRFQISDSALLNAAGERITSVRPGEQVTIAGNFKNNQGQSQGYAFIVQIVNEEGITTDIGWLIGNAESQQTVNGSRSWVASEAGDYTVRIFVWDSVEAPVPLAEVAERSFRVT